ncbi:hypothetical protein PZ07_05800 [Lacticaseibacillus rhamnosus]|nr:hypothetical protein PZ07_05800 [Lacticaseibacillus rhamnosus]
MTPNNPRLLAVQTLTRVMGKGGYSNLTLDHVITKYQLDSRDAGLLTNVVYGVIQHQLTLDYLLAPFVKNTTIRYLGALSVADGGVSAAVFR